MYRSHVLVCGGTGCTSSGSLKVCDALEAEIAGMSKELLVQIESPSVYDLLDVNNRDVVEKEQNALNLEEIEEVR